MTFAFQDLEGSQAADINQALGQLTGYGFVEGGEPHEGGLPFGVDVRAATTYIDGQAVSTEATSIDLAEYAEGLEKPRKVIIYIGADGEFHVAAGEPAAANPRGRLRFETWQPSPPDFRNITGVPVAEVWIGAYTQHVTDEDIRDRRLNSQMDGRVLNAQSISFQEFIDGSGTTKTELAGVDETFTPAEVQDVINADTTHGTDAPHDYFSGSHADLTNIGTSDHHSRYTDTEAVSAVDGRVDLATLTETPGTTPGYHLAVGNAGLLWENPPMAEAPVLKSGSITHTGGGVTSVKIPNITPTQTASFELATAIGVGTSPSWAADYAYSVETAYHWDESQESVEVTVKLHWETDPGSGNDLNLQYYVYEMSPEKVSSMYDDEAAAAAMAGEDLSLTEMDVVVSLSPPVYDAPGNAPSPTVGDLIISSDPDTGEFGEFIYDGVAWTGPYTAGVTALSDLTIDTAKDWGGHRIAGVGDPSTASSVTRSTDLSTHEGVPDAHHIKTGSSDIDHALISNVLSGQHHTRYADTEAVEVVGVQEMNPTIGATTIPDGGVARVHTVLDDGETCTLLRGEVMTEDGTSPSGLSLHIGDKETGEMHYIQSDRYAKASSPDVPLTTIAGPMTLDIFISNTTGQTVAAGGSVSYWLDQSGV